MKCKIGRLEDCERQSRVGCERCPDRLGGSSKYYREYPIKDISDSELHKIMTDSCGIVKTKALAKRFGVPVRIMAARLKVYQKRGLVNLVGLRRWEVNKEAIEELNDGNH